MLVVCACWLEWGVLSLEHTGAGAPTRASRLVEIVGVGVEMVPASTSMNKVERKGKNGNCQCFQVWGESEQVPCSLADA